LFWTSRALLPDLERLLQAGFVIRFCEILKPRRRKKPPPCVGGRLATRLTQLNQIYRNVDMGKLVTLRAISQMNVWDDAMINPLRVTRRV
jgi:hypothetical protein